MELTQQAVADLSTVLQSSHTQARRQVSEVFQSGDTTFVAYTDKETAMFDIPEGQEPKPGQLAPTVRNDDFLGWVVPSYATRAESIEWALAQGRKVL